MGRLRARLTRGAGPAYDGPVLILAIDTSAAASAAVLSQPSTDRPSEVLAAFETTETNTHSEVLAPGIDSLLTEAGIAGTELDGIVVGVGPGPFTGLRVGIATARTLGFVWGIPVHGVMSLDAIAWDVMSERERGGRAASGDGGFCVAIDARRKELYWARYTAAGELVDGPQVGTAETLPALPMHGAGAGLYAERLEAVGARVEPGFAERRPAAASLGAWAIRVLGRGQELLSTTPLYLRESDAKVPRQMKGTPAS